MGVNGTIRRRILVVDDDATVAEILARYLAREGYEAECVGDGRAAVERVRDRRPDLILLDLMLPGMSGLEVCRKVRQLTGVPIIMLTARGEENDRVFGLRLGADDYVVKPFSLREVVARVDSVLRRVNGQDANAGRGPERLSVGNLEIDVAARTVLAEQRPVPLTAREFDLLAFLAANPGRVFTRTELLEHVWGYRFGDTATVTVHVRRIRAKLEQDGEQSCIETVWGVGYRFRA